MTLSACSIIAEYNPFHNGHAYQLQMARQRSHADVMIAIMSGNWTQRGTPALIDKWHRTQMALQNGVDLVIELPVQFAVQPADQFALGGVQIAQALRSNWLAFGCEHANWPFEKLGQVSMPNDVVALFKDYTQPYAAQFQAALKDATGLRVTDPNDVLAVSYARAKNDMKAVFKLLPIQRIGNAHTQTKLSTGNFSSASSIRKALLEHRSIENAVPDETALILKQAYCYDWQQFWPFVRYQLIERSIGDLHAIYQMNEGIEHRLKAAALKHSDWENFIRSIKTKRYSYARLQRLLFYLLINADDQFKVDQINCLRVLGFNRLGQQYLRQIKKDLTVPLIATPGREEFENQLAATVKTGMLMTMQSGDPQDYYRHPIII